MKKAGCLILALTFTNFLGAQGTASGISYENGQLKIDASEVTLTDVLNQIAALTGVKIDVPVGVNSERLPTLKFGPGSARQVLATLLSSVDLNFLIKASDNDPEKIQSVLIVPAEKGNVTAGPAGGMPYLSADVRTAQQKEPIVSESAVPAQNDKVAIENNSAQSQPAQEAGAAIPSPSAPPDRLNGAKISPVNPPAVMSQQNINQQLQQMYQQRIQIVQQERQSAVPASSSPSVTIP